MATQIPNNTNINDIIKSSIRNLKDSTKIIKLMLDELSEIAQAIPSDLDNYSKKLDSASKILNNYLSLIQKMPSLSKVSEDDLKKSYKITVIANEYFENFVDLLNSMNDFSYSYDQKQSTDFIGLVNKVIESMSSLNDMPNFNIKQLLRTKLYLVEYEWILGNILDIYDGFKNYDLETASDIIDSIDSLYNIIEKVDEGEYSTLVSAPFKAALIQTAVVDIISMLKIVNSKLSGKVLLHNLEIAENSSKSLNYITDQLLEIVENLYQISKRHKSILIAQKTLDLLPDIFKKLSKLNESIKELVLDNKSVRNIVVFTANIIKIEKYVILMGLLAVPFMAAALLSLVAVSAGMWALALLMKAILITSNPVIIRAVSMAIRRLSLVISMIALSIAALAATILVILITHEMIVNNLGKILQTILCIGLILLAVIGLGWIMTISSPLIAAAMAGMVFVGLTLAAIIGISMLLSQMPRFDLSSQKQVIIDSVQSITSTAKAVINEIFGAFDDPLGHNKVHGDDGLVLATTEWLFGDTFNNIIKLLLSSTILVFTLFATILIMITATTLSYFEKNPLGNNGGKNGKIVSNVGNILETAKEVINRIFDTFDDPMNGTYSDDGLLLTLTGWLLGDMFNNVIKIIMSTSILTFTLLSTGALWITGKLLNHVGTIVIDYGAINRNVNRILRTAQTIIASVNRPMNGVEAADKSIDRKIVELFLPAGMINMIDAIMAIGALGPTVIAVGAVSFMANAVNSISKVIIDETVEDKAGKIIQMGSRLIQMVNEQDEFGLFDNAKAIKRLSILKDLSEVISGFSKDIKIQDHTKAVDNTIKFIDKIDKSKLENLQTTYKMFKEMKEFSESINGNFEGLAETINEQLMPVLEELKEIIGKIPESVNNSATTISGSINTASAWAAGTATPSMMAEQVAKEQPNLSKEDVDKIVDQKMVEQSQTVNKGIEMRLEELMEILQNYSNPVPVRLS